jgi:hypothetical protein
LEEDVDEVKLENEVVNVIGKIDHGEDIKKA